MSDIPVPLEPTLAVDLRDGLAVIEHDPGRASVDTMIAALDAAGYQARAAA